MGIDTVLRKLARTQYWQNIYRTSKENHGIKLFRNETNFSSFQSKFLYWLNIYASLYEDLQKKEYDFLDEEYLKNDLRVDAFLYYKYKIFQKEMQKMNQDKMNSKHSGKHKGKANGFSVKMK